VIKHKRKIYDLLDLLGDVGGVSSILIFVFSFICDPITHHSFVMKAMKKLYMVRTKDDTVFKNEGKKQAKMERKIDKLIPHDPVLGE